MSGSRSGLEIIMDTDPDPVCPERLDLINIRPDPKPCLRGLLCPFIRMSVRYNCQIAMDLFFLGPLVFRRCYCFVGSRHYKFTFPFVYSYRGRSFLSCGLVLYCSYQKSETLFSIAFTVCLFTKLKQLFFNFSRKFKRLINLRVYLSL